MKQLWTTADIEKLKLLYPHNRCVTIAREFKCGTGRIYAKANELGLHKSDEFKKSELSGRMKVAMEAGIPFRFKKGHSPFNKGLSWNEFMTPENQQKSLSAAYKKGHLPHNTKSDGDISIRKDKCGIAYQFIRTSLGKWKHLHVYNWEQENGPIPKGFIVAFKSQDHMNCDVNNLELITRRQNMLRNSIVNYPQDLQQTMKVLKKLTRTINGKE